MKIKATLTKGKNLKPGDLFSTAGPEYWENVMKLKRSCGERVYVRTETPADEFPDADEPIYLIEIER